MKKIYIFTSHKQLGNFSQSKKDLGKLIMMSFLLVSMLFVSNNQASAQCVISASYDNGSDATGSSLAQSFVATCDGVLSQVKLISLTDQTGITVTIYSGEGVGGSVLGSVTGVSTHNAIEFIDYSIIDLSSANISVTSGNTYTFKLTNPGTGQVGFWHSNTNHYAGGIAYYQGTASSSLDFIFIMDIAAGSSNAAPTATAPSAPIVSEDDTNVALTDDIQVADTDGDDQTVTFTITGGTLTTGTTGITFGGSGNGSASFTASGTLAVINTALDAATFTPTPNLNGTNAGVISFYANDGTENSNTASVSFNITAVNDDPTISGLPTDITVSEDVASNVDLSAATLSDVDAGANNIVLTIAASTGTLTASSGGPVTIGGSGTGTLSLTGAVANIDTYLNTASNIKYTSASNVNGNNAATLTLTANDGGNTGSGGGTNVTLGTVNVDITAVNDTPIISVNNALSLNEGATGTITSASHLSATDVDNDAPSLIFTITTNTSNGTVKKSGTTLNLNDAFTQVDLSAGTITYTHDGTNTTSDSFVFKVSDGSAELTNQTFSISVTAIDDDTPTMVTNNGLTLNEGATKAIPLTELEANDTDTDNASLTFTVTSAPTNGQLENTDVVGNSILSFTQQHLIDGKIQYVHDGSNTTSDNFTFKVADGTPNELTNQTFSISVTAIDDDTPTMVTNNGLTLNEGATKAIPLAELEADDSDTDNTTLTFTLTSAPSNGQLEHTDNPGVEILSFTQQHLIDGKIQYVHDGSNTTSDSFTFKVADGTPNELTNQTFSITVNAVDDDTPTMVTNNGLTLNEGATKAIPLAELEADDSDTDNTTLTFTLTSAPSNGQLEHTDNPGVEILSFTQQQLSDGKIVYIHDGSNTTSDSFTFKVADGTPNELTGQTFSFSVTAIDDDTPTISTNNGLTLNEGATKAIPLTELEANDTDTDNASLTFTLTLAPTNGQLEHTDNPGVEILSFTQQHLIEGKIQYVHDGSNTTSDSFTFKIADGTPNELTNQTFSISVTAIDDDTPTMVTNNGLTLNEGATKAIPLAELEADDSDTDNTTLTFTVTSAPTNGQLENTDVVGNSILSFTQQHLIDGKIQYVHDGSNTTSDSFTFKVTDGTPNELTGQNFSIIINAINDAPLLTTNTGLLLDEGATATLEKTKLNATDSDDNGTGLIYTLTTSVAHGSLFLDSNDNGNADDNTETILSGETFTQEDIENGKLKYTHDDSENFSDSFQFSLADGGEDGVSPIAGTFTFSIKKINDNNPVVKADQSFNLDENAANLSSVGTVLAADEDTETTFSNWTIVGGNVNNAFTINPSSGEITVNNSTALDWETIKTFELSITVSDGTSTSLPETVTVTLNDVFEKLDQNITFSQFASRTYGDADFNLIAKASSGLPVSYSSSNTSVATIAGNTVTILGAGSTSITASQSGNSTYNSATNVVRTLSVNKASQSIDFSLPGSITIDEGSITLVASSTSSLSVVFSSSDEEVATIDENTLNLITPGMVNIKANQAGNNNYLPAPEVTIQLEILPPANQAPVFENQTITLLENSPAETLVLELQAEDPDNDAITFSILEGNDNEAFKIEANQLLVNNSDALNLENHSAFELTVRADDSQAHTDAVITIQLEEDPSVGIDPELSVRFTLAPNPCSDALHLTFANPTYGEAKLAVYSLKGEKVISKSFNLKEDQTLNVSKLIPGVYILIIQQDQLVIRKRWIKI
ncbi:cadherin-like domain-containing protein [Sunxiuqinia elliptica]|uniref:cadherin-like domain-containing protein n=1 Tax=Sunxiuqinia elliptica TaxID=655355 RepID=UPI00105FFEE9|nr:cadherin-like domain-containing protein [Sunxiuqinia elliptica]TDO55778.1 putative secreted protein (Por secretion system target) [Sunxiuqinia elliptica]